MATIDQLNFEVILNDQEFNAKVKEDIRLANELNISLSQLLTIKNKVGKFNQEDVNNNRKANKILEDNAKTQEKITREKDKTRAAQEKLNASIQRATKGYQMQSRILNELKGLALGYLSIHGVTQLLSSLVRVTGEFELQKTTLAAMIGDLNTAENIISKIQGLAIESPFQFKELTTYAKQLSAFSVPAQELYDTTKMLADVSAGLGVGMDRIVLAYGQVRSAAFLRGQEVRQFTEAGIPILDELAKQFSELEGRAVSTGEVFDKISARLVPFEMVAKVFKDMTSEGGKFYNMQEVQAETLKGKLSNLKDAYEVMLNEIGKNQSENIKGAVDWVRRLMVNYEDAGKQLVSLIATYGIFRTILGVVGADHIKLATQIAKLTKTYANFSRLIAANPYGALIAGLTAIGFAIHRAAKAQTTFEKSLDITQKTVRDFNKNVDAEQDLLKYLLDRLHNLTVGTTEYNEVKSQILSNYGQYLSEIDKENLAVGNLAGMYEKLAESIVESNRQKALQQGNERLTQQFTTEYDAIFSKFDTTIKALGIENKAIRTALSDFVRGEIGLENLPEEAYNAVKDAQARINAAVSTQGGMFGSGVSFAGYDFELLKSQLQSVNEVIDESRERLSTDLRVIYGPMPSEKVAEKLVKGWRKEVQDLLTSMQLDEQHSFGLWAKDTTQATTYVEDMIKRYKELKEQIKWISSFDPQLADTLKKELVTIEAVANKLKIDIVNLSANKSDTTESKEERRIKRLVDALRTLHSQYEKLKAVGASDESIKTLFEGLHPELVQEQGKDFVTDLKYLERAKSLLEELAKLAPEDAKKLLINIEGDKFSQILKDLENQQKAYKESAKAAGEYFETLRKWATEDFNLNGESIALDISKITSNLNQKIDEIELRAVKAKELFAQIDVDSEEEVAKVKEIFVKEFGVDAWEDFWNSYYTNGLQAINDLADAQIEYERKLAQEKVNDLAEKYVKESYFTEGIDLSDLGDKTFFQLRGLRKKLQDILEEEPLTIPAEVKANLANVGVDSDDLVGVDLDTIFRELDVLNMPIDEATQSTIKLVQQIQQAGVSTDKFGGVIKKVFSGDLKKLTEEEGKVLANLVMDYLGELSSLFETIGEYAQVAGKDSLKEVANGITEVMDVLGPMAQKFAEGDWLGGIISGVTALTSKIFEALTAQEQLARAIEETAIQQRILNSEYAIMDGVEGSFGTDSFKKFTNAYEEATKAYKNVQEDLERSNKNLYGGTDNDSGQWGKVGGLGAGAALGAAIGSIFPGIGTALGAGVGALIGMITGAITDAALEADNYITNLQDMAEEIGAPLINEETGAYNLDTLKAIKETYKELSAEDKKWLDNAIANTEIYENALTAMADYMSSVFGSVADDIADAFITSFKESGQAALDYADIMDGVATQIAKDIIKSTLLQEVFDEELVRNASKKLASGDAAGALVEIDAAMQAAQSLAPSFQDFLEGMESYFQMGGDGASNLGEGIKGITEDTASLLASYMNAIRADVSFQKAILSKHLPAIGESMPTIMDHLAKIQANTFDISQSNALLLTETQAILGELRSVMTSDGGDAAIRIYS